MRLTSNYLSDNEKNELLKEIQLEKKELNTAFDANFASHFEHSQMPLLTLVTFS